MDATKPYEWKERYPESIVTPEDSAETRRLWDWLLDPNGKPSPDLSGVRLGKLRD